jgi:hypothetical protein
MNAMISQWRRGVLGVCLCVVTSVAARAQTPVVPPVELPKAVQEQLKDAYPGWAIVTPEGGCDGARLMVSADLDNDQMPDIALVISTPDGKRQLLAILPRVHKAVIHQLGAWTGAADMVRLHVLPMGRKFRGVGVTLDDYFSAQTLAAGSCSAATTAFVWNGVTFVSTPLQGPR